jgi:hypothetical protein
MLKEAEYVRHIFAISLDADVNFEDTLKPAYWAHVAAKLRVGDRVEVSAADGTWLAELVVSGTTSTEAKMSVYRFVELEPCKLPETGAGKAENVKTSDAFFRRWNNKEMVHEIIRKEDKAVVFSTKDKAEAETHVKELLKGSLVD